MRDIIKGKNVYLRPMTVEDTEKVIAWRNSEKVMDNFFYRIPITAEGHKAWLTEKTAEGQLKDFVICLNENDMPIGSIYLQHFQNEEAEWGIFMGEEAPTGKGIGCEAASLLVIYAFEELKLNRLTSRVIADNPASLKMNERVGYVRCGSSKEALIPSGILVDTVWFELNNPNK